jgi:hypothetical protein
VPLRAANDGAPSAYIGSVKENPTTRPRDAALKRAANDNPTIRRVTSVSTVTQAPTHPTVDQEFSSSYNKQGLQPSVGEVIDYNTPSQNLSPEAPRKVATSRRVVGAAEGVAMESVASGTSLLAGATEAGGLGRITKAVLPGKAGSYVAATEEAVELLPIIGTIWLTFQVPMAIMSTVALGLAAIFAKTKELAESNPITGVLWTIGSWAISGLDYVMDSVFGFKVSDFAPDKFLLLFVAITAFIVWIQFLIVGITYVLSGIPSLDGKASTLKHVTVIGGLVGGAIPILNFIPWAMFWVLVVTANPTDEES